MAKKFTENTLTEQPTIDWFKELGYEHRFGPEISPGGLFLERDDFRGKWILYFLYFSAKSRTPGEIS